MISMSFPKDPVSSAEGLPSVAVQASNADTGNVRFPYSFPRFPINLQVGAIGSAGAPAMFRFVRPALLGTQGTPIVHAPPMAPFWITFRITFGTFSGTRNSGAPLQIT